MIGGFLKDFTSSQFLLLMIIALVLITAGLLSSTAHLGRPERAWRAFSQWRTSWLSREGVAAVFTYVPAGLFALGALFIVVTLYLPKGVIGLIKRRGEQ